MNGLAYKEWQQNKWFILATALCGFIPLVITLMFRGYAPEVNEQEVLNSGCEWARGCGIVIAFLVAGFIESMVVFRSDDRKIWGYFISSTSEGYRGFLRVKYELIYIMICILTFILAEADMLITAFMYDKDGTMAGDMTVLIFASAIIQLLLRATDIPFIIRFGEKKGNTIKLIILLILFIILCVVVLTDFADINVRLYDLFSVFADEEKGMTAIAVCAVGVFILYFFSYRISCRLYLKGVEQYVK